MMAPQSPGSTQIEQALSAARSRADELGVRINVAIVDAGGNLAGFLRMPGAFLSSIELAIDKAYTSVSFGMPTRSFGEHLQTEMRAVRDGLLRRPRLTEVPGGLPIEIGGVRVGAVGVSGASEDQDEDVAGRGLAAFTAMTMN